ncbi:hypothetical protein P3X46_000186 [Hevea brasiliensis]|uniref:Uncharacterized protein n=1 Tax=Hevea brasiliensis TaxID=3981 RepID=A0ABQ9NAK8_HEVBR|nr:hypothetical protein P3X46_000186 [Hevea brasiliensis]
MANLHLLFLSFVIFNIIFFASPSNALSSCDGPCQTADDCDGQLIRGGGWSPSSGDCQPSGSMPCKGKSYTTYTCSPPVTSATNAQLTLNNFSEGGDGGAPSKCDEQYHDKSEMVVALSTGWYNGGSRCGQMITITASNGMSTTAKVVDECDSMNGCDEEHADQPPCENNIVDGSDAVWEALGLDKGLGNVGVTWSMA